jgi:hypothetical protein
VGKPVVSEGDPFEPSEPSTSRSALVAVAGLAAVVVVDAVWFMLARAYGADPVPWLAIVAVLAVPAYALAIPITRLAARLLPSPPRYWFVGLSTAAVLLLGTGAALALANDLHVSDAEAAAASCTPTARDALRAMPFYDPSTVSVTGADDGTCTMTVPVQAEGSLALEHVTAALVGTGWARVSDTGAGRELTRGGETVTVSAGATDGTGSTDVTLTIPPG